MFCLVSLTIKYVYYLELKDQTAQDIEEKGNDVFKIKASDRVISLFKVLVYIFAATEITANTWMIAITFFGRTFHESFAFMKIPQVICYVVVILATVCGDLISVSSLSYTSDRKRPVKPNVYFSLVFFCIIFS